MHLNNTSYHPSERKIKVFNIKYFLIDFELIKALEGNVKALKHST